MSNYNYGDDDDGNDFSDGNHHGDLRLVDVGVPSTVSGAMTRIVKQHFITSQWSFPEFCEVPTNGFLLGIPRGTEPYERVGDRIRVLEIAFRTIWVHNPGLVIEPPYTSGAVLDLAVVLDKQSNGVTAATISAPFQIWESEPNQVHAFPNPYYGRRFEILRRVRRRLDCNFAVEWDTEEEGIILNHNAEFQAVHTPVVFRMPVDILIDYNADGTITNNNLYISLGSYGVNGFLGDVNQMVGSIRVSFIDA